MSRVWGLSTIPIGRDACSLLLNALSKFLDGQYRHGRGKRGVPRVKAAVQRLGALVAVRVQFLGDVGGRDVVRAAAIDDDVAVLGQRGDRRDRLAAVEQQRARYRRLQQLRRHAARVDQYRIETLVYQLLQLLHRDAVDLHRLMETLALDIFERHEHQQQHAETISAVVPMVLRMSSTWSMLVWKKEPMPMPTPLHNSPPRMLKPRKRPLLVPMAPASGGAMVLKPGMNLATTSAFGPQRLKLSSVWLTQ